MLEEDIKRITLQECAQAIKRECARHDNCKDCLLFDRYRPDFLQEPTCPFYNSFIPADWLVD